MRIYPETKIAAGLILSFMLVLISAALTYVNSTKAIESGKSVSTGLELLAALESLFHVLRSIDKDSLAFCETGQPGILVRFKRAEDTVEAHMSFIKTLGATDGRRYVQITSLETRARALVNAASDLIRKRKRDESFRAGKDLRREQAENLEFIRDRIIYMESEEKEVIKRHNTVYENETKNLFQTYAVLAIVSMSFFLGLVFTLVRYIKSERKIASAERNLAGAIVAHAPIGVMILDETGHLANLNPTFQAYLKRDQTQLRGKPLNEVIDALPTSFIEAYQQLYKGEQPEENLLRLKEHMVVDNTFYDMAIWPVKDGDLIKGSILLASDVSDKVRLNRQRQLLFNTFTHDLKNPLIGNQYLLKALRTQADEDSQAEILVKLEEGNEDILKMVQNILEICKLQEEQQLIIHSEFELTSLLQECVDALRQISVHKAVKIDVHLSQTDLAIRTDRKALKHLLQNLLENAVKFSEEGTVVTVTALAEEEVYRITVKDAGPGIPEAERDKLFTSIWQGEVGRRAPGGSGIGLYLCGQLINLLGGQLSCQSHETGTTFTVSLPRKTDNLVNAMPAKASVGGETI